VKNEKLSLVFSKFAKNRGRAKGSVRNFYYDFLKLCRENPVLGEKYFASLPKVNKIKPFDEVETEYLIRKILIGKKNNVSVRRTIIEISKGDEKLMLRYQNKYRNVLKNEREIIYRVLNELGLSEQKLIDTSINRIPEPTIERLKTSINTLVENIAKTSNQEKEELKKQNEILLKENLLLKNLLKNSMPNSIEQYFSLEKEKNSRLS
jgi:hypothetical protein